MWCVQLILDAHRNPSIRPENEELTRPGLTCTRGQWLTFTDVRCAHLLPRRHAPGGRGRAQTVVLHCKDLRPAGTEFVSRPV